MDDERITILLEQTIGQIGDISEADLEAVLPSADRDPLDVAQYGNCSQNSMCCCY